MKDRSLGRAGPALAVLVAVLISGLLLLAAPSRAQAQGFASDGLPGTNLVNPTSLQFGPDDRLYVSQQDGTIKAYTVQRAGAGDYNITATETIDDIKSIQNHNDDGSTSGAPTNKRQVTGILVTGTAAKPVIYVTSSDPRIGGGAAATETGLDTNSGVISRLTKTSSSWNKTDLVRGLPRSEENHSQNGLQLKGDTLYVTSGGHTNMGAPSNNFNFLPEYALSAAVLSVDLGEIGNGTYDIPTLKNTAQPFGGQGGDNQAKIVSGGPVQVYSPGFRNAYDLVIAESGKMYTFDNGPNAGWGGPPVGEGTGGNCTNEKNEDGDDKKLPDNLHLISGKGYYGGDSNPTRGNPGGSGFSGAVPQANPVECEYRNPGAGDGALTTNAPSTNGMVEYTASNFNGALQGDLLAAAFNGSILRLQLNGAGDSVTGKENLLSNFGSTPLDVTAQGDDGPFPGTIWAATYGSDSITVFEPNDFGGGGSGPCDTSNPDGDADGDGYTNKDEADNNTDPCSAGSKPPDFDDDGISNKNDPDDDDDGITDTEDEFAVDSDNGKTTDLPVGLSFAPGSFPGTILDLGFTGLMTNGESDYQSLYDESNLTAGGAAQVLTIDKVPNGDAVKGNNTQKNGFQLGVNPTNKPFTAHTRLKAPFKDGTTPQDFQSVGFFIGTGDQSNYLKLVVSAKGGDGGIEFAKEVDDKFVTVKHPTVPGVKGSNKDIDLFLKGDPATNTVEASYSINGGEPVSVGSTSVPASWIDGPDATAVGLTSTSFGTTQPFPATWDFLDVTPGDGTTEPPEESGAEAQVKIKTPNKPDNIMASTFDPGSFQITNSSATENLDSVTLDLSTAALPDLVFDPEGKAGDKASKAFTVDSAGGTGQSGHELIKPHNGTNGEDGYEALEVEFDDFNPGETFTFSIDVDPNSIKGTPNPGPNRSGSVSGLELTGSTVTAAFDDGSTLASDAFSDGSKGGSEATIKPEPAANPKISVSGVSSAKAEVAEADQTVKINGPAGAKVQLLRLEAGLFVPQSGGYKVEPFDANSAVALTKQPATIGSGGAVNVPVTLTRQEDPEAGINHLVAVVEDAGGDAGATSNVIVLDYKPGSEPGNQAPTVTNPGDQKANEGEEFSLQVEATDPDEGDTLSYKATGLPAGLSIDSQSGEISGTIQSGAAANSPYTVKATATDQEGESASESFAFEVSAPGTEPDPDPDPVDPPQEGPSELEVSPENKLGFGRVDVGKQKTREVTLTNNGENGDQSIEVESVRTTGAAEFSVTPKKAVELEPGESHELRVTFDPDRTGFKKGNLIVGHSGDNEKIKLRLVGKGVPGAGGCTIMGTAGDDVLRGTARDDVICGRGGNDKLYGLGGDDKLKGGSGIDRLHGGSDEDRLYGGPGRDFLYGNNGNDRLYGGGDNDRLYGQDGKDFVFGTSGNDYVNGGASRDVIRGETGNDRIVGSTGNDIVRGGDGNDTIRGGPGSDRLFGEGGKDRLVARDKVRGNDYANGGAGKDRCVADPRDRTVRC